MQKGATSHYDKAERNATTEILALGSCNPLKRRNTTENRTNIQDVRLGAIGSKGIYQ